MQRDLFPGDPKVSDYIGKFLVWASSQSGLQQYTTPRWPEGFGFLEYVVPLYCFGVEDTKTTVRRQDLTEWGTWCPPVLLIYVTAVTLSMSKRTFTWVLCWAKAFTAKAPPINCRQFMWSSLSKCVQRPPLRIPLQTAPHPTREASVSIVRSGSPFTKALPFQAIKLSLHHISSSRA